MMQGGDDRIVNDLSSLDLSYCQSLIISYDAEKEILCCQLSP